MVEPTPKDGERPQTKNNPKPSLLEDIQRGWAWVVFVVQMLGRIGGPIAIARSLSSTVAMLLERGRATKAHQEQTRQTKSTRLQ